MINKDERCSYCKTKIYARVILTLISTISGILLIWLNL